jgi:ribosome-binding protein aMBF1 (putative translation factor)
MAGFLYRRMKKILYIGACSALIAFGTTACERMDQQTETQLEATEPVEREEVATRPVTVQDALREDARLARTMSLEQFAKHMRARQSYYQQFEEVKYEDDFVKIKMEDDELKIETAEGKAKFDEDESKIKTDSYKKKTEVN